MMMIRLVGPANEGRMWKQSEWRNLFGKPKQHLRIRQFHYSEEMEVAVPEKFFSGILLKNNITTTA